VTDTDTDGGTEVAPTIENTETESTAEETPSTVQAEADETPEGGIAVTADSMDELLAEDADDLDEVEEEPAEEAATTGDAEVTPKPAVEKKVETKAGDEPKGEATPEPKPEEKPKEEVVAEADPAQAKPEVKPDGEKPAEEKPEEKPVVETAPVLNKEQQTVAYDKWRGESEELLATQHFVLSEDMAAELEISPEVAVPKLLSKVYLDAVTASVGHMMTQLPGMIEATVNARKSADTEEAAFFEAWAPHGLKAEHRGTVITLGQTYRSVHPKATAAEFTRDVGAQAIIALGLAKADPVIETPQAIPFTPASTSSAPGGRPVEKDNPFSELAREMDTEDLDLD
jgi:hypothetical protein